MTHTSEKHWWWQRGRRRRPPEQLSPGGQGSWSTGQVMGIIFLCSSFLLLFVLFMQRQWRLSGQRVVVVVHDSVDAVRKPMTLVGMNTASDRLFVMPLPREQPMAVWGTPAQYPVDALVGYTQLERLQWKYTQLVVSLEYGVVVDGMIWTHVSPEHLDASALRGIAFSTLWRRSPTTLTYWDRWKWWQMVRGHRGAVSTLEVGQWLASDGSLDRGQYDRAAVPTLQDRQIRESRLSVAVLNGSGQQGEAARLGRLLERSGYDVRAIDTLETTSAVSSIQVSPDVVSDHPETVWAVERLRGMLAPYEWSTNADVTRQRRVDVVITLGQNELARWKQ